MKTQGKKEHLGHTEIRQEEADIIQGANQQDQLDRLKQKSKVEKAPNKLGSPPSNHIDKGE